MVRLSQGFQEGSESIAIRALAVWLGVEDGVRLERPIEQVDRPTSVAHRLLGRFEIVGHVDEDRGAGRGLHAPTGLLMGQQQWFLALSLTKLAGHTGTHGRWQALVQSHQRVPLTKRPRGRGA